MARSGPENHGPAGRGSAGDVVRSIFIALLVRAMQRGQWSMVSQRALGLMLSPHRGQFR